MKRTILTIAFILIAHIAFADCTQAPLSYQNNAYLLTFACTADAGGGFTGTGLTTSTASINFISGKWLNSVEYVQGATQPTASWAFTVKNSNGMDVLGGVATGLSATTPGSIMPFVGAAFSPVQLTGSHVIGVTGNSVSGAVINFIFHLSK